MKSEFTAIVKKVGNSHVIFIPKDQLKVAGVKVGDAVRITLQK